ncbi:acid phosphatase [Vibrio sp. S17_S38]|uniref:5'/3'-nucleotidase SurE n=1 Tax=Vibrio sp. S17_S38 TaxID=2720229 RepID=UPI00168184D6|nr:5'/3'-nucleotidase SurE [Vibrio sp. S17_S38]MBD1573493.1 acid phosphatase [Vibrio sp. S17_S38]
MKFIRTSFTTVIFLSGLTLAPSALALNIVLTNDDSWDTQNIKNMKSALEAAGHDVIMSAPCGPQSGKGGSMVMMKAVTVNERGTDEFCVGDTDTTKIYEDYVEGTPVMAALYGIDVAAQKKWGTKPDLVISGPNEGNNLGYMNNNSGTLGAAMISLSRGVPAIAVSGGMSTASDDEQSKLSAQVVVDIVTQLVNTQKPDQPLLPAYTGLNVNTPEDMKTNLGYKYTDVGWNSGGTELTFSSDLGADSLFSGYAIGSMVSAGMTQEQAESAFHAGFDGKIGLSASMGDAGDSDDNSEGVAVQQGYITISTIDGNIQASRAKVALTEQRLVGLK